MRQKLIEPDMAKLKIVDDSADTPGGFIEGYASVFGNADLGGDVVEKGAFTKTLRERLKKGAIKLVDSHKVHEGTAAVIGVLVDAKEDDYGLWFKAKLSTVQRAQDIRVKVREQVLNALSFGYDIVKAVRDPKAGVQLLKELKLYEVSVVIWGMNPLAETTTVKGLLEFQPFTLAAKDHQWNAADALARVKAWVSPAPEEEWTPADQAKFARTFLWAKDDDLQFPVVDIVDGEPQYVLVAIYDALTLARTEVKEAPWAAEAESIEGRIKDLYLKFGEEFPVKGHVQNATTEVLSALKAAADDLAFRTLLQSMNSKAAELRARY